MMVEVVVHKAWEIKVLIDAEEFAVEKVVPVKGVECETKVQLEKMSLMVISIVQCMRLRPL